MNPEPWTLNA